MRLALGKKKASRISAARVEEVAQEEESKCRKWVKQCHRARSDGGQYCGRGMSEIVSLAGRAQTRIFAQPRKDISFESRTGRTCRRRIHGRIGAHGASQTAEILQTNIRVRQSIGRDGEYLRSPLPDSKPAIWSGSRRGYPAYGFDRRVDQILRTLQLPHNRI